jgi:hypothetical protein
MNIKQTRFATVAVLVLLAALSRVVPHPYNFTPICAMALFGAARFDNKIASFIVPALAMFISDAIIGFHDSMLAVYGAFAVIVTLGIFLLKSVTFTRVVVLSVLSSTLFFLITNFAVWYGSSFYPQNIQGLLGSYVAGLAFYQNSLFGNFFLNTIIGDLFYSGVLFGCFYALQKYNRTLNIA